jgi:2-polyprenyl-3-methyl-5-hydroxy-6-metoxy-1,4-benzoquinol methylase
MKVKDGPSRFVSHDVRRRSPVVSSLREGSRAKRAAMFHACFTLKESTRVLDLGGSNGSHIHALLSGTSIQPENVYVADISSAAVKAAHTRYGFQSIELTEGVSLPIEDKFFDIVFCSSVLEHVTVPKADVWAVRDGKIFRNRAVGAQKSFADEIRRVGHSYFVQVPYRWFPIETHTWLPFVGYLPRALFVPLVGVTNRFWIKGSNPDFHLPSRAEYRAYFPDAEIYLERTLGLVKSLIAIKR